MRCIVSLSLPKTLCEEIEREMKELKIENKSEFIRHLLRFYVQNKKK